MSDEQQEDAWREARLDLLCKAHSVGAFPDLSFEVVPTRYSVSGTNPRLPFGATCVMRLGILIDSCGIHTDARPQDFAVRIEAESFSWVSETTFVGYRLSAELLSQQLIMPMISTSHFAFGSQEVIAEMTDDDLEKVRSP